MGAGVYIVVVHEKWAQVQVIHSIVSVINRDVSTSHLLCLPAHVYFIHTFLYIKGVLKISPYYKTHAT